MTLKEKKIDYGLTENEWIYTIGIKTEIQKKKLVPFLKTAALHFEDIILSNIFNGKII